jgi:hypothetical protein
VAATHQWGNSDRRTSNASGGRNIRRASSVRMVLLTLIAGSPSTYSHTYDIAIQRISTSKHHSTSYHRALPGCCRLHEQLSDNLHSSTVGSRPDAAWCHVTTRHVDWLNNTVRFSTKTRRNVLQIPFYDLTVTVRYESNSSSNAMIPLLSQTPTIRLACSPKPLATRSNIDIYKQENRCRN